MTKGSEPKSSNLPASASESTTGEPDIPTPEEFNSIVNKITSISASIESAALRLPNLNEDKDLYSQKKIDMYLEEIIKQMDYERRERYREKYYLAEKFASIENNNSKIVEKLNSITDNVLGGWRKNSYNNIKAFDVAAAVVASLIAAWLMIVNYPDFLVALHQLFDQIRTGSSLFITPAYGATPTVKPLTPIGSQKVVIIYLIYSLISVTLIAAIGLLFTNDDGKQDIGKDLIKLILGFLIGTITGQVAG